MDYHKVSIVLDCSTAGGQPQKLSAKSDIIYRDVSYRSLFCMNSDFFKLAHRPTLEDVSLYVIVWNLKQSSRCYNTLLTRRKLGLPR